MEVGWCILEYLCHFAFRVPGAVWAAMMPAARGELHSIPMYDPRLLQDLDWSQNTVTFSPAISPAAPGDGLILRPLCSADISRGTAPSQFAFLINKIDALAGRFVPNPTTHVVLKWTGLVAWEGWCFSGPAVWGVGQTFEFHRSL